MSKLSMQGEIMLHYARALSANCKMTTCSECPFHECHNGALCLLEAGVPKEWAPDIRRKEGEYHGTQEDNC